MKTTIKYLLYLAIGLGLAFCLRYIDLKATLVPVLKWVDSLGFWGAIAFAALYIIATAMCLPGSILALAGGVLFGKLWGSLIVFMSAIIGAYIAFNLSRYYMRDRIEKRWRKHRYSKIINQIADGGWKIACLLHLSPIIPFNLINYALGASKISQKDFLVATFIGILPGVLLYAFIGSTIGDLTMLMMDMPDAKSSVMRWVVSGLGILSTLGLTLYLARLSQQQIKSL